MTFPPPFGRVGIVGLGLIGGSLARRLKAGEAPPWIVASSLDGEELRTALEEGVIDRSESDPVRVAEVAGLVVYCTPVGVTLDLIEKHRNRWRDDAVITDVAGLKSPLLQRARTLGFASRFVGGHPLAGTEGRGYRSSRPDLFEGETVHLVRGEAEDDAAEAVRALWLRAGARPTWTGAEAHDRTMVWSSHLPQMVASALGRTLAAQGIESGDLGPGGRDMTRLASSPGGLWSELLTTSPELEIDALSGFLREIRELLLRLEKGMGTERREVGEGTVDETPGSPPARDESPPTSEEGTRLHDDRLSDRDGRISAREAVLEYLEGGRRWRREGERGDGRGGSP